MSLSILSNCLKKSDPCCNNPMDLNCCTRICVSQPTKSIVSKQIIDFTDDFAPNNWIVTGGNITQTQLSWNAQTSGPTPTFTITIPSCTAIRISFEFQYNGTIPVSMTLNGQIGRNEPFFSALIVNGSNVFEISSNCTFNLSIVFDLAEGSTSGLVTNWLVTESVLTGPCVEGYVTVAELIDFIKSNV